MATVQQAYTLQVAAGGPALLHGSDFSYLGAFRLEEIWQPDNREILMCLEALSRYLRLGGDDCDREITDASWMSLALDGEHMDDEPSEDND